MKFSKFFLSIFVLFLTNYGISQLVITEIMYNPPESGQDSLEYIEIYNASAQDINLNGYSFLAGVTHTFGNITIESGGFVVVAEKASAMMNVFGIEAIQWEDGALSNGGERIALQDAANNLLDEVDYDDGGDWPLEPDGSGFSLELCDPADDNSLAENWLPSNSFTGVIINGGEVVGSPGAANNVECEDIPDIIDIVITEIMYNDPGANDSLEFIEIYNFGNVDVNLAGWDFGGAVEFSFPSTMLEVGQYMIVCNNSDAFEKYYGTRPMEWVSDGLNNSGELVQLRNDLAEVMDEVEYSDSGLWPGAADGLGSSLVLCHPSQDNTDPLNWQAASIESGFSLEGTAILSTPGAESYCFLPIRELRTVDTDGIPEKIDWPVQTQGTVYGVNMRSTGLQLTIIDDSFDGMALINTTNDFGYTVHEGDILKVKGRLDQFNGLSQIVLDTVWMNIGDALFVPSTVTSLDESTESQLIKLEGVRIKTPSEWTNNAGGFNVTLTNGEDDFAMRIDGDVDIFGMEYPSGTFDVSGIGGQFDSTIPYNSGYQILPRYRWDIEPYNPFVESYPIYDIGLVTTVDAEGKADSIDQKCELQGIVYGINFRPSGLHFTLIDDKNDGIRVFSLSDNLGYTVTEGDELSVKGGIEQFNGVIRLKPDTINIVSQGNELIIPDVVSILDESTESQFIMLENFSYVDPTDWAGDGSSFDVEITDGVNNFNLRIDNDTEMSTMQAPAAPFNVMGLGGQFDSSEPFTDNYELFPRYLSDFESSSGVLEADIDFEISISPNPAVDYISINSEKEIGVIKLSNLEGKLVVKDLEPGVFAYKLNTLSLNPGLYIIELSGENWRYIEKLFVVR